MKEISVDEQLEIFDHIFFTLIETPSMRDQLKGIIESRERVDFAEVDLQLAKLAVELEGD